MTQQGSDRSAAWLFAVVVLIWSTTWLAVSLSAQTGDLFVAVATRFGLAGVLLLGVLAASGRLRWRLRRSHLRLLAVGSLQYSVNFILFYHAARHLASGMLAVIFSLTPILSAGFGRLLFGQRVERTVLREAAGGTIGLAVIASGLLSASSADRSGTWIGIALALAGTTCFAAGTVLAARWRPDDISGPQSVAYAMICGAAVAFAAGLLAHLVSPPAAGTQGAWLPATPTAAIAWAYLVIFGSLVVFVCYLALTERVGAARAGLTSTIAPAAALGLSAIFEHRALGAREIIGCTIILASMASGRIIAARRKPL